MTERRFDVTYNADGGHNEVVESFITDGGQEVEIARGQFPFTGTGDADAELFCAVLRAVGGATVGWADAIREHGFALAE